MSGRVIDRKLSSPALFGAGVGSGSQLPIGSCGFASGSPSPIRTTRATSAGAFGRRINPPIAKDKKAPN